MATSNLRRRSPRVNKRNRKPTVAACFDSRLDSMNRVRPYLDPDQPLLVVIAKCHLTGRIGVVFTGAPEQAADEADQWEADFGDDSEVCIREVREFVLA